MFARVFALLPLALLVSASHLEARDSCNTGSIKCCESVQDQNQAASILSDLGITAIAADVGALIGVTCSGVTAIGLSRSCSGTQQPTCCTGNSYNGGVVLGCSPFNINL